MFNPKWYANSRIDGFAILEFLLSDETGRKFIPLQSSHLSGSILGPFADFSMTHVFRFSREQCPNTIEALYRFPLPGDVAVTGITVTFGQTVITATLKARSSAETDYAVAKKERKSAALLTRESPNVFTLRIAGLAPDEDVVVKTQYVQMGDPEGNGFVFRIPLTTPPRYVREDEQYTRAMQAQPLGILRDPGHRFSMAITAPGVGSLSSTTHDLICREAVFSLVQGEVIPDRDFILFWEPFQYPERPSLQVFSDDSDHPHFLALVTPPQQEKNKYPRELIILVDHSGSMDGPKRKAADRAVERLLASMRTEDSFNLCLFESISYWVWTEPRFATSQAITDALLFLSDERSGGTNLGVALEQALHQTRREGEIARNIVIITDAQVTDNSRILQLLKHERTQKRPRRCSILCIDSAPNVALATAIARYGRGSVRFLTSSPDEEDIQVALDNFVALWYPPAAINLILGINRKEVIIPDRTVLKMSNGSTLFDLGDFIPGKSIWIYGRCGKGQVPCTFTVMTPSGKISAIAEGHHPSVRYLYGATVVNCLDTLLNSSQSRDEIELELSLLGYALPQSTGESGLLYHENIVEGSRAHIKELLIRESLAYGIVSTETAFIALRKEADRLVEESVIVPNALPSGWSEQFGRSGPKMCMIMQSGEMASSPRMKKSRSSQSRTGGVGGIILLPHRFSGPSSLTITLFKGIPVFSGGESLLFDSGSKGMQQVIPRNFLFRKIILSCQVLRPEFVNFRLMLFIGDMVRQVVGIQLSELIDMGGEISFDTIRKHGAVIRVLLMDVSGTKTQVVPEITVTVEGEVL